MVNPLTQKTCREIFAELLSSCLSSITLQSTLAHLGPLGETPLAQLNPETLGVLRRRLIKIGRCYLTASDSVSVISRFDRQLRTAGFSIPMHDAPTFEESGPLRLPSPPSPNDSGVFRVKTISSPQIEAISLKPTPPPEPQPPPALTKTPTERLVYPFRTQFEWVTTRLKIRSVLIEFLQNEATAFQVENDLDKAAQSALTTGGGEVVLEENAGAHGRLAFQVVGADGQSHLSGEASSTRVT